MLIGCSRVPRDVPASATETRTHWNCRYRRVCLSRCRPGRRLPVLIRSAVPVAGGGVRLGIVGRGRGLRGGLFDPARNQPVFGAAECARRSHQGRFRLLESFIAAAAAAFSCLLSSWSAHPLSVAAKSDATSVSLNAEAQPMTTQGPSFETGRSCTKESSGRCRKGC